MEGGTLGDILEHYDNLVPAYDKCREDVLRVIEYMERHKQ